MQLPSLEGKRAFVETTESTHSHGGAGWQFGRCLWSPVAGQDGRQIYEKMREPEVGDIVLHFYSTRWSDGVTDRRFCGFSFVDKPGYVRHDEPPVRGGWDSPEGYYRIDLRDYTPLHSPIPIAVLVDKHKDEIRRDLLESHATYYPFAKYRNTVRLNQGKYLTEATARLYKILAETSTVPQQPGVRSDRTHDGAQSHEIEDSPQVDQYVFARLFRAFRQTIENESGIQLRSFQSNPVTDGQEGYKLDISIRAKRALASDRWTPADIGTGSIAQAVIAAIEVSGNNLLIWDNRRGPGTRLHQFVYDALQTRTLLSDIESAFYDLFLGKQPENEVFDRIVELAGRRYPLLAYLYFVKDRSRFMPIAPETFDSAFSMLGAEFKTTGRCSWINYLRFNDLLRQIRDLLGEELDGDPTLLDAHSFAWMLVRHISSELYAETLDEYVELSAKERDVIARARIGQGRFRRSVITYWQRCSVTGCSRLDLLQAAHIKPWADCSTRECIDGFNGLLLTPTLHSVFDKGYITFNDDGLIELSKELRDADAAALGIHGSMQLRKVTAEHIPYLAFHRKRVFRT